LCPHGVLFRGGAEGAIRQKLIEENLLDAVIGLPSNLFYGTGIPAAILLFKRNKPDDTVIFIDASQEFAQGTNQNKLREQDVEKVVTVHRARRDVEKYAKVVIRGEIVANDFNLNIPRYVEIFEDEGDIDIQVVQEEIMDLNQRIDNVEKRIESYLRDLELYV